MDIIGLDHITVNVKDLQQSRAFYENVIGLVPAGEIQMSDHLLVYYELPQGVRLELIDYENKDAAKELKETDIGAYRHFCIVVKQLDQAFEECRKNEVFVRKTPSYVEELGCQTMLITDPNGVEIEIIQR